MYIDAQEIITFIETTVQGIPALFVAEKVSKKTVPDDLHYYMVSYIEEETIDFDRVAKEITDHIAGTLLTIQPLKLNQNDQYQLNTKDDLVMNKRKFTSINAFLKKYR